MSTPGAVLKVRGNAATIQLSGDRKFEVSFNYKPDVSVGDIVTDEFLQACEQLAKHASGIVL